VVARVVLEGGLHDALPPKRDGATLQAAAAAEQKACVCVLLLLLLLLPL
jgi:hypothetical protein